MEGQTEGLRSSNRWPDSTERPLSPVPPLLSNVIISSVIQETSNSPGELKHVAGAANFSPYGSYRRKFMGVLGKGMHPDASWEHSHSYSFPDGQHYFIN